MAAAPRLSSAGLSALAAVTLVLVGGCAGLGMSFEEPRVSLTRISLVEAGLLEQRYEVLLRVQNPNDYALPIKSVDYRLEVAGNDFASGLTPEAFRIPANGDGQVRLEVRTNLLQSLGQLGRFFSGNPTELDYEIAGRLRVDLPLIGAVPFNETGSIPLVMR